ncbi:MAG: polysulfide reductase NrfD [Deferribacteres bacterium]|nr:polysulfide reductase NrfD [Deferribacteres bacterium]
MNFGFVIDNRKCIGCHACTVACKAEHDVPLGVNRTWVKYVEKGTFPNTRRLFSVMRCNHCEDAPCVTICPVSALYKRPDGIVDFDKRRCIGCKSCMQACPYDALYIDPESLTAAKCNYCAHRIDIGLEPACVNVCPEHAIISGNMDDPQSEIAQLLAREQVHARKIEKGTLPKLFYIEADAASLVPGVAGPEKTYTQAEQTAGVGHFARYAEMRMDIADPEKMAQTLAGEKKTPQQYGVTVPADTANGKMLDKAWAVVREQARRVYDAPSKGVLWGWEVSAYVWTKAIAAGAFLIPFLALWLNMAPLTETTQWTGVGLALVFLAITGFLLIKDLDQPSRFVYVLLRPQWGSWLVKGGYFITFYGFFLVLWGIGKLLQIDGLTAFAMYGGLIFSVLVAIYTAFLFAQAKGRDFWQTPVLPIHMLVHAAMAGASCFAILDLLIPGDAMWASYLSQTLQVAIVVNVLVMAFELIIPHPTADAKLAVKMITKGQFGTLFHGGVLAFGNLLPLLLIWLTGTEYLALAGALVLIGLYFTEHIWLRAPQHVPLA